MVFTRKARAHLARLSLSFTHPMTLAIIGTGFLSYSAYLIYKPAAFAVAGVLFLVGAWDAGRE